MIPNGPSSPPSLSSIPGISVWYGPPARRDLAGDREAGGAVVERHPVPGATMPEPKWSNMLWISDTAMPSSSTAQM